MFLKKTNVIICFLVVACAPSLSDENFQVIEGDRGGLYAALVSDVFTLDAAVSMALENNLDARIAEQDLVVSLTDVDLQKFNALPTITAKRQFLRRNNDAASSSISSETGVESLESSISSDRGSRVDLLELNWELMDSAINIYRSNSTKDQAEIAKERYRKVLQNIAMDTSSAFYRLGYLQAAAPQVDRLLVESEDKLEGLRGLKASGDIPYERIERLEKEIFSKRTRLLDLKKSQRFAALELKALLSISPEKDIRVVYDEDRLKVAGRFWDRKNLDSYVDQALSQRPEVREELLSLKIAKRNVKAEILGTFPGLGILATANRDDNSFLENSSWFNLSATLSQSLTRLLTLPARHKKSKQEVELANARRRALVAAVIYQVNIAYAGYADAYSEFLEEERAFQVYDDGKLRKDFMKESGLISGLELFIGDLEYQSNKIELDKKIVEVILAEARLEQSAGGDFKGAPKGFSVEASAHE